MPYITKDKREEVELDSNTRTPENAGELNYQLTDVISFYLQEKGLKYQTINDIIGALEGCKAEFQRRIVGPYEDLKITENGDIPNYYYVVKSISEEFERI